MACQTDRDGYSAAPPYRSDRAARLRKCPRGGHSRGERALYGARAVRRGGRVAEGARLESVFTGNRNVGSNSTPSARKLKFSCFFWLLGPSRLAFPLAFPFRPLLRLWVGRVGGSPVGSRARPGGGGAALLRLASPWRPGAVSWRALPAGWFVP